MKSLIVATLMGMAAAHYGIDDTTGQNRPDSVQIGSTPVAARDAQPADIPGNFDIPAAQATLHDQGDTVKSLKTSAADRHGLTVPANLAPDVARGVAGLEDALSHMPRVAIAMARSIDQHGIAALAYDDPKVKVETESLTQALGRGLGGIAQAVASDMVETTRKHPL